MGSVLNLLSKYIMLFWEYSLKIIYIKCPQALSVEDPVKSLCVTFNKRSHTQPLQTQPNLDFMDYPTITKILQKIDIVILKNNKKRKSRLQVCKVCSISVYKLYYFVFLETKNWIAVFFTWMFGRKQPSLVIHVFALVLEMLPCSLTLIC